EASPKQRSTTNPAIGWIQRCNQIIQSAPNHPYGASKQARHRVSIHRSTWWSTGRTPGDHTERIVIQAFAEDSPHSQGTGESRAISRSIVLYSHDESIN